MKIIWNFNKENNKRILNLCKIKINLKFIFKYRNKVNKLQYLALDSNI